jgi:hypothetical protein
VMPAGAMGLVTIREVDPSPSRECLFENSPDPVNLFRSLMNGGNWVGTHDKD